jgi:hypothetical protein
MNITTLLDGLVIDFSDSTPGSHTELTVKATGIGECSIKGGHHRFVGPADEIIGDIVTCAIFVRDLKTGVYLYTGALYLQQDSAARGLLNIYKLEISRSDPGSSYDFAISREAGKNIFYFRRYDKNEKPVMPVKSADKSVGERMPEPSTPPAAKSKLEVYRGFSVEYADFTTDGGTEFSFESEVLGQCAIGVTTHRFPIEEVEIEGNGIVCRISVKDKSNGAILYSGILHFHPHSHGHGMWEMTNSQVIPSDPDASHELRMSSYAGSYVRNLFYFVLVHKDVKTTTLTEPLSIQWEADWARKEGIEFGFYSEDLGSHVSSKLEEFNLPRTIFLSKGLIPCKFHVKNIGSGENIYTGKLDFEVVPIRGNTNCIRLETKNIEFSVNDPDTSRDLSYVPDNRSFDLNIFSFRAIDDYHYSHGIGYNAWGARRGKVPLLPGHEHDEDWRRA